MNHSFRPVPIPPLPMPPPGYKAPFLALEAVFDAVFVINLFRRPDRWTRAKAMLEFHGTAYPRRVDAVDGRLIDGPTAGVLACIRSHAKVHKVHEEAQGLGRVLVLEDDALAPSNLRERVGEIAWAPRDWDLLVMGRERGWGSFAYAASAEGSRVMLELLKKESQPVDVCLLFEASKKVKTYEVEVFRHADERDSDIHHAELGVMEPEARPPRGMGGESVAMRSVIRPSEALGGNEVLVRRRGPVKD